ncbi:hypothetical protein [Pseudohalocynthiibacter sp. F2068]|jgi:hypothetical protein|uniref:hypothetical protein n=1 Tax=Pseudohalocynthiibacter sp. F2068 TaxID=2926418 RepID=UPI001FF1BEBE|nr:hypothetical protein [Pseudohalocynthiibacter sp. F2068]MCK0103661.1 hypothetical protein [Pseudohalocynthiibacter sp. F2068]
MVQAIHAVLVWTGERARWVLLAGCFLAFLLPFLSSAMRPFLPALIALVLGLSVARLDLAAFWRGIFSARRIGLLIGLTLLLMPVTALLLYWTIPLLGLPDGFTKSALLFALAPPISSAAGLCFILGYDPRRALELTLVATLLTPLIGPAMLVFLMPGVPGLEVFPLMAKLSLMIALGLAIGLSIRAAIGGDRIAGLKTEFDGLSAIGMVLFVIPLFEGVGPEILARPMLAFGVAVFVLVLNFGSNYCVKTIAHITSSPEVAGALGLMWGNRTVALYLAALPFDPLFSLFVALYQFPMYATPLVFRRISST